MNTSRQVNLSLAFRIRSISSLHPTLPLGYSCISVFAIPFVLLQFIILVTLRGSFICSQNMYLENFICLHPISGINSFNLLTPMGIFNFWELYYIVGAMLKIYILIIVYLSIRGYKFFYFIVLGWII